MTSKLQLKRMDEDALVARMTAVESEIEANQEALLALPAMTALPIKSAERAIRSLFRQRNTLIREAHRCFAEHSMRATLHDRLERELGYLVSCRTRLTVTPHRQQSA